MKNKKRSRAQAQSEAQSETCKPAQPLKCPIVGLGASAGGLESFQQFLDHMPPNSGMAFVLLQHLDPTHESLMPELLAKHTAMPVKRIEDAQAVEANHVYVIPANAVLTMEGCALRIKPLPLPGSRRLPIDEFFRSLARDQGENVIGIVLSGTGNDGTLGLRTIKQEGGLTIAQTPELAKYDSMPRNAIVAGVVDHVLPVQQMPGVILEYIRHVIRLQGQTGAETMQEETTKALSQVCPLLHRVTGHDFSRYKQSTLLRRIQRRMQIAYAPSLEAYIQLLRNTPREVEELFKDLLIGVTQFFRDPEAFEMLVAKVLPEIFREKSPEVPLRVWVPGCATGEEAYSLAMLLADHLDTHGLRHRVRVFATDIDDEALECARKAQYPESIKDQMPGRCWKRYFAQRNGTWEITEQIREMCVFSLHNLIKDPPFSHLDLISCRNLLIYMEADLQRRLLPLFHYALNPSGFLFLGSSENIAARSELFRLVDKKHRIFQRKPTVLRPIVQLPAANLWPPARFQAAPTPSAPLPKEQTVVRSIERVLLEELAPPGMVINDQGEVLYFSGQIGDFLQPTAGVPSNKILNLVRKSLRLDLRTNIHRAVTTRQPTLRENLPVRLGREVRYINLIVRPLAEVAKEELYLIAFQPVPGSPAEPCAEKAASPADLEHPVIRQLENELRVTQEELQNTIEELETSNEELRSVNEEQISMNEELQSTNEELQTSKEELQSLYDELQRKMEELDLAHTDLQNLVQSSQIPTVFLDAELRIRKFTPALEQLVALRDKDIGSSWSLAAPELARPELMQAAREVMGTLKPQEEQFWLPEKQAWYIARITPYRTLGDAVLGAVITFTDVTELKRVQEHRNQLAAIVETSTDAIFGIGLDRLIRSWNRGAERIYGWSAEEVMNRPVTIISLPENQAELETILARLMRNEPVSPVETVHLTKGLKPLEVALTFSVIKDGDGTITGFSAIARDIADRKQAEISSRLLAAIVESSDDAIVSKDLNGIITSWNEGAGRLLGYTAEEIIGKPVTTFIPAEHQYEEPQILARIRRGERIEHYETIRRRKDGTLVDVSLTVSPIRNAQGEIIGASKIARNISDRKRAERAVAEAQERLARANQDLEDRVQMRTNELVESNGQLESLVYSIAHDLRAPLRAMQSFSSMLLEDYRTTLGETGQDYASRIMRSAESMDRLILDLLAYGRVGQISMELAGVNIGTAWNAAVAQNQALITEQKAVLEVVQPLLEVKAHEATLTQVLANLLNNAVRFVPPERSPLVRLRTERVASGVRIWIEDNGIGIAPKYHEQIFRVFQQLHGKKFGGTGVGLAIVRRGVERMGGYVGLESAPGKGTRFWVELPAS